MPEYEKIPNEEYEKHYDAQYGELGSYQWKKQSKWKHYARILQMLEKQQGKLLEVACGDGVGIAVFTLGGYDVTACDISRVALEHARKNVTKRLGKEPNLHRCDCRALPFDDDSFDIVVCSETIEHLTVGDEKKLLKELGRVCKPDGQIIVTSCHHPKDPIPIPMVVTSQFPKYSSSHIKEYDGGELAEFVNKELDVQAHEFDGTTGFISKLVVPIRPSKVYISAKPKK